MTNHFLIVNTLMLPEASISFGTNTVVKTHLSQESLAVHFGVCPVTVSLRDSCDARTEKTVSPHALLL